VRVADFSWVGVGPLATQQLAWLGADVVRVESTARLDVFRGSGPKRGADPDASAYFGNCNRDKRGITLNLKRPGAREAALRLAERSDILVESFTPGFMRSAGLSYEDVRAVNPGIIMLSASMEGGDGPHAQFRGFGLTLQATVGFTHFTGWPGRAPTGTGVAYTDWVATGIALTALLAALEHRRRTGEGQYIDLSQLEACTWALDAEVLDFTVNGRIRERLGNRHPVFSPHGVFRCRGDDRWLALAVRDDGDWERLRGLLAADGVALPACESAEARRAAVEEIDAAIDAWTRGRDRFEAAAAMQAAGLPAHAVLDVRDVHEDEQLRARGHFWRTRHPVIGEVDWDGPAYRLTGTPLGPRNPAPMLGQANHEVYTELLGYSDEELAAMAAAGVLD
jgi:crotonobetainyl-CoA:carnitine CoA-transferase CaiB-like acyl-CoA transferase